jgi:pimeloyl-ACP methyl ester carboxylesterase
MNPTRFGIASLPNKIDLYYETFGNEANPPVLLIMGLDTQCLAFTEEFIQPLLDNDFYCIRFDNRDIGKSTWLNDTWHRKSPYTLEDMAQDSIFLLDYLNLPKAHLIGVSMGGMIAQRLAISFSERILSICSIMSSAFMYDGSLTKRWQEKLYFPLLPFLFRHFHINHPILHPQITVKFYMKMYRYLNGTKFRYDEEKLRKIVTEGIDIRKGQNPKARYQQFCAIIASGSRIQEITKINIPFLVIHGSTDPIVPVNHAYKLASLNRTAKLVIVEGMGHTMPKEAFGFFYPQLLNHLSIS